MAGVDDSDDPARLEDSCKNVLHLPHRKSGATHIGDLRVRSEKVQVTWIVRVGSAVSRDVDDDDVLWTRLGEAGEERVSDILNGRVAIEQKNEILFCDASSGGR